MKITAITRFKHGKLYSLLEKLGWTQVELARRAGVGPNAISRLMNLKHRPTEHICNSIQKAFAEAGEFLDVLEEWPETFRGLPRGFKIEQTQDVPAPDQLQDVEFSNPVINEVELNELARRTDKVLASLPGRERTVIEMMYFQGAKISEIAKKFNVEPDRIRQILHSGFRKLRHPTRRALLFPDENDNSDDDEEPPFDLEEMAPIIKKYGSIIRSA